MELTWDHIVLCALIPVNVFVGIGVLLYTIPGVAEVTDNSTTIEILEGLRASWPFQYSFTVMGKTASATPKPIVRNGWKVEDIFPRFRVQSLKIVIDKLPTPTTLVIKPTPTSLTPTPSPSPFGFLVWMVKHSYFNNFLLALFTLVAVAPLVTILGTLYLASGTAWEVLRECMEELPPYHTTALPMNRPSFGLLSVASSGAVLILVLLLQLLSLLTWSPSRTYRGA